MRKALRTGISLALVAGLIFSTAYMEVSAATSSKSKSSSTKAKTIVVTGVFDGKGQKFGGVGNGSQSENQPAVFELKKGAILKNVIIVPPSGDGIHVEGDNIIENVTFQDVGEDAISMRSSAPGGKVTIKDCTFNKGEDKIFQANKSSEWVITNCTVNGAGKVFRQNGGKKFPLKVTIDGLKATGVKEAIVRSDDPTCQVLYRNITCNLDKSKWWYGSFKPKAF